MNFLLLLCTLVATLFMLPSIAPLFSLLPWKVWSFAALDNIWSSFFLPSRSSILNLVYLCYFKSPICDFRSYSSPPSLLSNATVLTQFEFFKLFPTSHNGLIMDWFSRANLYTVPRVTVSSFGFEIDIEQSTVCALSSTFYIIPIKYSERDLWRFSQGHPFEMKFMRLQKN